MSIDLQIPIAVSARHAHLSQATIERLFGEGYVLDTDEANAAGVASGDLAQLVEPALRNENGSAAQPAVA